MLFDVPFIADWKEIGEHRQRLTDLNTAALNMAESVNTSDINIFLVDGWIIFLDDPYLLSRLLYNFVNKKTVYFTLPWHHLHRNSTDLTLPYLLYHPTNNSTMVSCLPLRQHDFGESSSHPREPIWKGLAEVPVKGIHSN